MAKSLKFLLLIIVIFNTISTHVLLFDQDENYKSKDIEEKLQSFVGRISLYQQCLRKGCPAGYQSQIKEAALHDGLVLLGILSSGALIYSMIKLAPSHRKKMKLLQAKILNAKTPEEIFNIIGWEFTKKESTAAEYNEETQRWEPLATPSDLTAGWHLITPANQEDIDKIGEYGINAALVNFYRNEFKNRPSTRFLYRAFDNIDEKNLEKLASEVRGRLFITYTTFGGGNVRSDYDKNKHKGIITFKMDFE